LRSCAAAAAYNIYIPRVCCRTSGRIAAMTAKDDKKDGDIVYDCVYLRPRHDQLTQTAV